MTSESFHALATCIGEVESILTSDGHNDLWRSQSTYEPAGSAYDLGTTKNYIPPLSPEFVSSFFTELNSEEDSSPMSDCSDDGSSVESDWRGSSCPSCPSSPPSPSCPSSPPSPSCPSCPSCPSSPSSWSGRCPGPPPAVQTTVDVKPLRRHTTNKKLCTSKRTPPCYRRRRRTDSGQQLWQFILETLNNDSYNPELITWVNREAGVFKFIQSRRVAELWNRKRGGARTFEHISRSIRHYYRKGIMSRIPDKRLVYKFESNATDWVKLVESTAVSVKTEVKLVESMAVSVKTEV